MAKITEKRSKVSVTWDRYLGGYTIEVSVKAWYPETAYDLLLEAMATAENKLDLLEAANEIEANT